VLACIDVVDDIDRTLRAARPLATEIVASKILVEVVEGPDSGRRAEIGGPEVTIGSAPGCDLALSDPAVSRAHLKLSVDDRGIRVVDAGSRNGTFIDGVEIRDAWAETGSVLRIGSSSLTLRKLDEVVRVPLSPRDRFGPMIGRSVAMRRLFALLERVAVTEHTVLVEGETGTGKELVAEAIHEASRRPAGPFVVFDCSAVAPTLVESELFGHVAGAFTGALQDRTGAFELAHGGTLFLDEIGELPLDLQPKLLRVLERREVRRVGANDVRRADVRIVAATNRSLATEVERGRFREDLYYRLAVVTVTVPPLRERLDDVAMLARHFAEDLVRRHRATAPLGDDVVEGFTRQSWPGNVRELRNAVVRALAIGSGGAQRDADGHAAPALATGPDLSLGLDEARDAFERAYLLAVLERSGGNVTRAAELAGTNRRYLQRAMKRFGLRGEP
jgi:transcriptional regulator with GAF, ATPase, and Fis domain